MARALEKLATLPEKIDTRTKEGRRYKPVLIAAATEMREEGHTWDEIAAVVPMNAASLSMACTMRKWSLHRVVPRAADPQRMGEATQKALKLYENARLIRDAERRANEAWARKHLRRGDKPWHLVSAISPNIDPQLLEDQAREMRWGNKAGRPWELSMAMPWGEKGTLMDTQADYTNYTESEDVEELMRCNGI